MVLGRYATFMAASQNRPPDQLIIQPPDAPSPMWRVIRLKYLFEARPPLIDVVTLPDPLERAQLVPHWRVIPGADAIFQALADPSFDPRQTVLLESDIERALNQVRQSFGRLDILVNNAGIVGKTAPIWELNKADMEKVLAVNLVGPFLWSLAVIPQMLESGYGRIVNVSSIAGKEGNPQLAPYSASKAGLIALTKSLAKEVAGKGDITVNAVTPAVIATPILDPLPKATVEYMVSRIPMGRTGRVEEVAALVHFLVSAEASFTTGQSYDISGGRATY